MKKRGVAVKGGRLEIGGKPRFLYSGEMHYFRMDPKEWPALLRKAKSLGMNAVSTYVPWRWHEVEAPRGAQGARYDFSGATDPRRDLERYIELVRKSGLDLILRLGPVCNGEMRYEGLPDRVACDPKACKQPEEALHHSTAPGYLAKEFLKQSTHWLKALLPIVVRNQAPLGGPVILVQLDNEIGMVHWISGQKLEPASFAKYFGALRGLARKSGVTVPLIANIPQFYDYDTRGRGNWAPLTAQMFEEFEARGVNLMGGAYQPRRLDNDNVHDIHLATEAVRSVQKDSISFCAETQVGMLFDRPRIYPRDVDLLLHVASMTSLRGLNLYMLAGGENPPGVGEFGIRHDWQAPISPEGVIRDHGDPIRSWGRTIGKIEPYLAAGDTHAPVDLAVPFEYYRDPKGPRLAECFTHLFDATARLLFLAGFPPRWIWLGQGANRNLVKRPFRSKHVFVFSLEVMDAAAQREVVALIRAGRKVVIGPELPVKDARGRACTILADFVGAKRIGGKPDSSQSLLFGETILNLRKPCTVSVKDAWIVGTWGDLPIAFTRRIGRGRVTFVGQSLSDRQTQQKAAFEQLLVKEGLSPLVSFRSAAEDQPVALVRRLGKKALVLVANMHETDWTGEVVVGRAAKRLSIPGRSARLLEQSGGRLWQA